MKNEIIIKELKEIRNQIEELLQNNTNLEIEEFKKFLAVDRKIWDLENNLICDIIK